MQRMTLEKVGFVAAGLFAVGAALASTSGCASSEQADQGSSGSAGAVDSPSGGRSAADIVASKRSALDEQYVMGPSAADRFGYRVAWDITPRLNDTAELGTLQGDSLFIVDADNSITRLLRSNGTQTWVRPIGSRIDSVLGVQRASIDGQDVVMALTEGDLHVFETGNGVQRDRQSLSRVASTSGILFGPALIYGSLNGQIVWHHYELNSYMGGNSLYGAVSADPVSIDDVIVCVSDQGHVLAVDAGSRVRIWDKMARAQIVAEPAISQSAVYVASIDQHIRCYDINNGQVLWDHLHSGPLTQPPVLIADKLLLQTPDLGLVCFEALPYGDLDGNILWSTSEAKGTVIGRHRGQLIAWDGRSHTLEIIDEQGGGIVDRIPLPKAEHVLISEFESGEIYAIATEGRVTKVVPRQ
jgi:outer membrane protein assembly factor BamB